LAAVAIFGGIASGAARADHPGCLSDWHNGWYTDNQESFLILDYINWGYWDSTGDYIARRYDRDWNVTFREWRPGDEGIFQAVTPTGGNLLRRSSQQRAGYGWREHGFSQYHHC